MEVRLVDREGDDVLVGDPGEIIVRGPNVFDGYWEDPVASKEVLVDGWLVTGDIAVVDDGGTLVDRRPGQGPHHRVGLQRLPGRGRGGHPGAPRGGRVRGHRRRPPTLGRGRAAPTSWPAPGWSLEEDDIIEFCASRLARYKAPSKVTFVDDIPSLPTGKILRRQLRDEPLGDDVG